MAAASSTLFDTVTHNIRFCEQRGLPLTAYVTEEGMLQETAGTQTKKVRIFYDENKKIFCHNRQDKNLLSKSAGWILNACCFLKRSCPSCLTKYQISTHSPGTDLFIFFTHALGANKLKSMPSSEQLVLDEDSRREFLHDLCDTEEKRGKVANLQTELVKKERACNGITPISAGEIEQLKKEVDRLQSEYTLRETQLQTATTQRDTAKAAHNAKQLTPNAKTPAKGKKSTLKLEWDAAEGLRGQAEHATARARKALETGRTKLKIKDKEYTSQEELLTKRDALRTQFEDAKRDYEAATKGFNAKYAECPWHKESKDADPAAAPAEADVEPVESGDVAPAAALPEVLGSPTTIYPTFDPSNDSNEANT